MAMHPSRTHTAVYQLPIELLDDILSFLVGDKPTLASCCQVSKTWLPSSRRYLFHTISRTVSAHPLSILSSFTHKPQLATLVKELTISGTRSPDHATCFTHSLLPALAALPHLHTLTILDVPPHTLHERKVVVRAVFFAVSDVLGLLSACAHVHIHTLKLLPGSDIVQRDYYNVVHQPLPSEQQLFNLRTISAVYPLDCVVFRLLLCSPGAFPKLSGLALSVSRRETQLEFMQAVSGPACVNIQSLKFTMYVMSTTFQRDVYLSLDLSGCQSLERLALCFIGRSFDKGHQQNIVLLERCIHVLSTILSRAPNSLRRITLALPLWCLVGDAARVVLCDGLRPVLKGLSRVQTITIRVYAGVEADAEAARVLRDVVEEAVVQWKNVDVPGAERRWLKR
ncbi:hypothetical protein EIP91_010480 [Steccherinum ochraceum]|uniref:F-box domain-containing protein n=1 Tax=Steccherinum ochraceum TaxID=92696 RepID=A0A4R0RQR9_9APHY|nr:hypothetical protein EIP91_010480 [Steccherinum ochraceum]